MNPTCGGGFGMLKPACGGGFGVLNPDCGGGFDATGGNTDCRVGEDVVLEAAGGVALLLGVLLARSGGVVKPKDRFAMLKPDGPSGLIPMVCTSNTENTCQTLVDC